MKNQIHQETGKASSQDPVFAFNTSSNIPGIVRTAVWIVPPVEPVRFSSDKAIHLFPVNNILMGWVRP